MSATTATAAPVATRKATPEELAKLAEGQKRRAVKSPMATTAKPSTRKPAAKTAPTPAESKTAPAKPATPTSRRKATNPTTPKGVAAVAARTKSVQQTVADLAAKDPSDLHERFAEWLTENGFAVDAKTVQMVHRLGPLFQRSAENQAALANTRSETETRKAKALKEAARKAEAAEKRAAERKAKLVAEAAKLGMKLA